MANVMALCRSSDGGATWQRQLLQSTESCAFSFDQDPNNPQIQYISGWKEDNGAKPTLLLSENGGASWSELPTSQLQGNEIYKVVVHPTASNKLFVGTNNGLFLSQDQGQTWTKVSLPVSSCMVKEIVFHANNPDSLYILGNEKIYFSSDGGENWTELTDGLENKRIVSFLCAPETGYLFAGTIGDGIYRYSLTTEVAENTTPPTVPHTLSLEQNYPNPFNPTTTIRYGVPRSLNVPISIRIFSPRGRLIRTLIHRPHSAGQYEVIWNGQDEQGRPVASGFYLCVLQAGEQVLTQKMLLLK